MEFKSIEEEIIYEKMCNFATKLESQFVLSNQCNKYEVVNTDEQNKLYSIPNEVYDNIRKLEENRVIIAHRPLISRRKYLGKLVTFVKKAVRKTLKWYINPITDQQTLFNSSVTPIIGRLTEVLGNTLEKYSAEYQYFEGKLTELRESTLKHNANYEYLEGKLTELEDSTEVFTQEFFHKTEDLVNQYKNDNMSKLIEYTDAKITEFNEETNDRLQEIDNSLSEMKAKMESQMCLLNSQISDTTKEYISKIKELEQRINNLTTLAEANSEEITNVTSILNIPVHEKPSFFDKRTFAQSGEDSIIEYIFFVLGIELGGVTYLDLGANHAKELSNTYALYKKGAKGVLVEANPELVKELSHFRYNDVILNRAVSTIDDSEIDFFILSGDGLSTNDKDQAQIFCQINPHIHLRQNIKVRTITVNTIIEKYMGGVSPNLISIDIEGMDMDIIKSIDLERFRPLIIVVETIEYRPFLDIEIKSDDVVRYMETIDYYEYAFTGINSIFIDKRYMKKRNEGK